MRENSSGVLTDWIIFWMAHVPFLCVLQYIYIRRQQLLLRRSKFQHAPNGRQVGCDPLEKRNASCKRRSFKDLPSKSRQLAIRNNDTREGGVPSGSTCCRCSPTTARRTPPEGRTRSKNLNNQYKVWDWGVQKDESAQSRPRPWRSGANRAACECRGAWARRR